MDSLLKVILVRLGYCFISKGPKLSGWHLDLLQGLYKQLRLKRFLDESKITHVIDVGANNGAFSRTLRRLGYEGKIYSFEPNPIEFKVLEERFKKDLKWRGYNFALGSHDSEMDLMLHNSSVFNSFLKSNILTEVIGSFRVKVRRLDDIFHDLFGAESDAKILLKIDTQGYDLEVVKGAFGCLGSIFGLLSEVAVQHLYEGTESYLKALEFYESLGFHLLDLYPVVRDPQGCIMEYDCLMAKK